MERFCCLWVEAIRIHLHRPLGKLSQSEVTLQKSFVYTRRRKIMDFHIFPSVVFRSSFWKPLRYRRIAEISQARQTILKNMMQFVHDTLHLLGQDFSPPRTKENEDSPVRVHLDSPVTKLPLNFREGLRRKSQSAQGLSFDLSITLDILIKDPDINFARRKVWRHLCN